MELSNKEKYLLTLYSEFFGLEYDLNDDRIINVGKGFLKRHIEMQNIAYLIGNFDFVWLDYGFVWNYTGPYSFGLECDQNVLDTKKAEIATFYEEYKTKRGASYTYEQQMGDLLKGYCSSEKAKKIAFSSFVVEDIMKHENGSIILAGMIYLYKTVLPTASKNRIFEELEKRLAVYGIKIDRELEEIAWRDAQIIGLIEITKKYPSDNQRRLTREIPK